MATEQPAISHAFDGETLDRVRRLGGETLVARVAALFVETGVQRVADISESAASRNPGGVARAAHSLRGSAGNVGALTVVRLAAEVERAATANSVDEIPALVAQLHAAMAAAKAHLIPRESKPPSRTIAVVEDHPDNRLLVNAILQPHYLIHEYATGEAALDGLRRNPVDLVLLDISLPDLSGPEVLARLREEPWFGTRPVVALTAHAMAGDRERFLAMGFDDYITKPITDPTVMVDTLRKRLAP